MQNRIVSLKGEAELDAAFKLIRDLRPHLDSKEFHRLLKLAKEADNYQLIGYFEENALLGLMGMRLLHDFAHGTHLYIDDLVVRPSGRRQGIGSELLKFAEKMAPEWGCSTLRLCRGLQRIEAHRVYERNGWEAKSLAFKKPLAVAPEKEPAPLHSEQ